MPDESIGGRVTYGYEYTYPILFIPHFQDRRDPFITEVDFEYRLDVICHHPKDYVLLQKGMHGLFIFDTRSCTWRD